MLGACIDPFKKEDQKRIDGLFFGLNGVGGEQLRLCKILFNAGLLTGKQGFGVCTLLGSLSWGLCLSV